MSDILDEEIPAQECCPSECGELYDYAHRAHDQLVEAMKVVAAARHCSTHPVNADTCGVCGQHFADCEEFVVEVIPAVPACPGAQVRKALVTLDAFLSSHDDA